MQFDDDDAVLYGVPEAILMHNFRFWILKNKANGRHFYEGRTWTYNKLEAFPKLLRFWTKSQVERILNSLVKQGVVLKGNFNSTAYDRTCWYAFVDESKSLKTDFHFTENRNGKHEIETPIPDSITDTTTDNKNNTYGEPGFLEFESSVAEQQKKEKAPPPPGPPPTSRKLKPKVGFSESLFADLNYTKQFFQGSEYQVANFDYYHQKVKDWAESKGIKRDEQGWRDTFQNWIYKDSQRGYLRTINDKIGHAINKPSTAGKQPAGESWADIEARYS